MIPNLTTVALLILCIPLFMFLLLGIAGCKLSHKTAGWLGCLGMGSTMCLSYYTSLTYYFNPAFTTEAGERIQSVIFNTVWLQFTDYLHIDIGFLLDPISALMLIVITTIALLLHVYSLGYMEGE